MPNDRTTPAGTWQVEITAAPDATFEDRGLRGQTAEGLLVLEADHTCLCLTPGLGAGTWQSDGSRSISFDFAEFINYHREGSFTEYVKVTQKGTMSTNGDDFATRMVPHLLAAYARGALIWLYRRLVPRGAGSGWRAFCREWRC